MRWAVRLACVVAITGCGDRLGADTAPLCMDVGVPATEGLRLHAVYRAGSAPPEIMADVAVEAGRACVDLRPPRGQVTETIPAATFVFEAQALDPLVMPAVPIDFGVYVDRDASGDFGPGDVLRARWSGQPRARVPLWLPGFATALRETPSTLVPEALAIAAPGGRPFAFTPETDVARVWTTTRLVILQPWPDTLTLPPTAPGTACDRAESWPRCRVLEDVEAFAAARLIDPRVPEARLAVPIDGFDPQVPLPPADAPVSAEVRARDCADIDGLRVAREIERLPRQAEDACECTIWVRTRYVIAPSDDPPPWLTCGGRPLTGDAATDLAEEAGLAL